LPLLIKYRYSFHNQQGVAMKRAGSLPGLIVLSLHNGEVLGAIRRGVEDPYLGRVLGFAFEDDEWYEGPKVLPFKSVESFGLNAVIVGDNHDIMSLHDAADVRLILKQKESLLEKHIMTSEGRYVGEIFDYAFNEENGQIGEYYLHRLLAGEEECYRFPAEKTQRVGKGLVIVEDGPMIDTDIRPMIKRPWAWMPEEAIAQKNGIETPVTHAKPEEVVQHREKPKTMHAIDTLELFDNLTESRESKSQTQRLRENFQRHHYTYLLGRHSDRDIYDDEGDLIIRKGQVISEETIVDAKKSGKFMQLALSSRMRH
jgi:uncharacterized protein YrrD